MATLESDEFLTGGTEVDRNNSSGTRKGRGKQKLGGGRRSFWQKFAIKREKGRDCTLPEGSLSFSSS